MTPEVNKIYCGDCLEVMQDWDDGIIDCVITDPPYFLPATHYQTRKKFGRNFSDLGMLDHFINDFFKLGVQKIKQSGIFYVFSNCDSYPIFYYHLYSYCRKLRSIIWDKKRSFLGYTWRHQHEIILFGEMPEAKPVNTGDGDIIKCDVVGINNRLHPAEKPTELLKKLIEKSTNENDLILDPFLGSGTTAVACKQLNRNFIGIEISEKYCKIAEQRLRDTDPLFHQGEKQKWLL